MQKRVLLAPVLVAPVLLAPVLLLLELLALVLVAPVLLAMCYKHQRKKHIASGTVCYGISDIMISALDKVAQFSHALPKN